MDNIAKILKNSPKGIKVYSPIFGYGDFIEVDDGNYIRIDADSKTYWFNEYGRYKKGGECLLFPSKDNHV